MTDAREIIAPDGKALIADGVGEMSDTVSIARLAREEGIREAAEIVRKHQQEAMEAG